MKAPQKAASASAEAPKYLAKHARPITQQRPNFVPAQSWLAYNWLDRDPELDYIQWAIADSGKSAEWIERECEKNGHRVSRYTILNWCFGDTKRPQNASMNSVMAALGYERTWHRR